MSSDGMSITVIVNAFGGITSWGPSGSGSGTIGWWARPVSNQPSAVSPSTTVSHNASRISRSRTPPVVMSVTTVLSRDVGGFDQHLVHGHFEQPRLGELPDVEV